MNNQELDIFRGIARCCGGFGGGLFHIHGGPGPSFPLKCQGGLANVFIKPFLIVNLNPKFKKILEQGKVRLVSLNHPIFEIAPLLWVKPDSVRQPTPQYPQRYLKKMGVLLSPWLISGLLGVSLSVPRSARANSGHIFLETIGISIAVGTVLGASTLPFYDQPGKHLLNLAYGASLGAVTGLGIMIYGWIAGPGQDEYGEAGFKLDPLRSNLNFVSGRALRASADTGPAYARGDTASPRSAPVYPAQFWVPVVSLNW